MGPSEPHLIAQVWCAKCGQAFTTDCGEWQCGRCNAAESVGEAEEADDELELGDAIQEAVDAGCEVTIYASRSYDSLYICDIGVNDRRVIRWVGRTVAEVLMRALGLDTSNG